MKTWEVKPTVSIGELHFGIERSEVREKLGPDYREIKKTVFSRNTMDAYETFHVYYDKDDRLEAVEFFDGNKLTVKGKTLFPGKASNAQKLIPHLAQDDEGFISADESIGFTVSPDDSETIEGVLIGCAGYYSV